MTVTVVVVVVAEEEEDERKKVQKSRGNILPIFVSISSTTKSGRELTLSQFPESV